MSNRRRRFVCLSHRPLRNSPENTGPWATLCGRRSFSCGLPLHSSGGLSGDDANCRLAQIAAPVAQRPRPPPQTSRPVSPTGRAHRRGPDRPPPAPASRNVGPARSRDSRGPCSAGNGPASARSAMAATLSFAHRNRSRPPRPVKFTRDGFDAQSKLASALMGRSHGRIAVDPESECLERGRPRPRWVWSILGLPRESSPGHNRPTCNRRISPRTLPRTRALRQSDQCDSRIASRPKSLPLFLCLTHSVPPPPLRRCS